MAIKKRGNTGFLNGTTVEKLGNIVPKQPVVEPQPQVEAPVQAPVQPQTVAQPQQLTQPVQPAPPGVIRQVSQQIIEQRVLAQDPVITQPQGAIKFGRPRQELIRGVHEVSVNLQLPETLVEALRAKSKAEKKSMKELIGLAVMDAYPDCWSVPVEE